MLHTLLSYYSIWNLFSVRIWLHLSAFFVKIWWQSRAPLCHSSFLQESIRLSFSWTTTYFLLVRMSAGRNFDLKCHWVKIIPWAIWLFQVFYKKLASHWSPRIQRRMMAFVGNICAPSGFAFLLRFPGNHQLRLNLSNEAWENLELEELMALCCLATIFTDCAWWAAFALTYKQTCKRIRVLHPPNLECRIGKNKQLSSLSISIINQSI